MEVANDLSEALLKKHTDVQSYVDFENAVLAFTICSIESSIGSLTHPGFSSVDQFKSYTERGELFILTVLGLKNDIVVNKSNKYSNFLINIMKVSKIFGVVLSLHLGVVAILVVQSGRSTRQPPTKTYQQRS